MPRMTEPGHSDSGASRVKRAYTRQTAGPIGLRRDDARPVSSPRRKHKPAAVSAVTRTSTARRTARLNRIRKYEQRPSSTFHSARAPRTHAGNESGPVSVHPANARAESRMHSSSVFRPRTLDTPSQKTDTLRTRGSYLEIEELMPHNLPLWREWTLGVEWMQLRLSPQYYGMGIPHGNGAPVILVPGFFANDLYLFEMHRWLKRIGYKPYYSNIGHNSDCPNVLVQHLLRTVVEAHHETGCKVHMVGHSFGGVLSRVAASFRPDLVASVSTMASPFRGVRAHPFVLGMSKLVHTKIHSLRHLRLAPRHPHSKDCYTSACACGFACSWRGDFPEDVQQLAIYTKGDGVVDYNLCRHDDRSLDIRVSGSHCGLVWNAEVYRILASKLYQFSKNC